MKRSDPNNTKIFVHAGPTDQAAAVSDRFRMLLADRELRTVDSPDKADLIACIGGDGSFLHFMHRYDFPSVPVIGINTGHLGFFQEINPDQLEQFIDLYIKGRYQIQEVVPIEALIYTDDIALTHVGINEILIRGPYTHITHLKVEIGSTKIQEFSGDGILICTPVGSTAYNYSLGGAIISPDLHALQMTPVAPSNTNAYRCFPSSILYSDDQSVTVTPIRRTSSDQLLIAYDGVSGIYDNVDHIDVVRSDKLIRIIRFERYDYWKKLTSKLL